VNINSESKPALVATVFVDACLVAVAMSVFDQMMLDKNIVLSCAFTDLVRSHLTFYASHSLGTRRFMC
jgi:hypothetical protein